MRNPSHSAALWRVTASKFTAWLINMTTNNDAPRWGMYQVSAVYPSFPCSDVCLWGLWTHHTRAGAPLPPPQGEPPLQPRAPQVLRQETLQIQQQQLCKHAAPVQLLSCHSHLDSLTACKRNISLFYSFRGNHKIILQHYILLLTRQQSIMKFFAIISFWKVAIDFWWVFSMDRPKRQLNSNNI